MKKRTLLVAAVGAVVFTLFAGALPAIAPAQPKDVIRWKGQSAWPGGISGGTAVNMAGWLNRMSNGQLVVDVGAPGSIVPVPAMFDAVSTGLLDYANTCSSFSMGKFPEQAILSVLPGAYTNMGEAWDFLFERGAFELIQEAYAERNIKWFPHFPNGLFQIGTTFELKSIHDIKGKKLRVTGSAADVMKLLGASPVFLPVGDIYMALKLRTIDGYVGGADYMEDFKLKEMIKTYIKEPNLTCIICEHIINMNSFNKLPAALRERIQRDARHAEVDWTMHMTVNNSRLENKLTKENGIKFITLPQNEQEEIMKAVLIVWDSIAAKSPRSAKLIDIIKAVARDAGKIK